MSGRIDFINLTDDSNLCQLLRLRCERSPDAVAYLQYDRQVRDWSSWTWRQFADRVSRWQQALLAEQLEPGDRVALMLPNCTEWAAFDLAAQGLGLVVVPLYVNDRPQNVGRILDDCGAKMLVVGNNQQWQALAPIEERLSRLSRVLTLEPAKALPGGCRPEPCEQWLPAQHGGLQVATEGGDVLASIVYTSGTMGRPKGVMLSHRNILANVLGVADRLQAYSDDVFLSFLPLSHMLERTGGLYLPMAAGATVAFARAPRYLSQDLAAVRPTIIVCVPRVFEAIYAKLQGQLAEKSAPARALFETAVRTGWQRFEYQQGRGPWRPRFLFRRVFDRLVGPRIRNAMGGRLRCAVAGGAPMPPRIASFFIGAGIPILHGYGATETAPVVAVNTFEANNPESVGHPLPNVEVKLGAEDELLARGPNVMIGYWNNPEATAQTIDADGWLHTGDRARLDDGRVFITGRIKEIIVLANGENVSPVDLEQAICMDPLFAQAMVIGDGKPYLGALVVLDEGEYDKLAASEGLGSLEEIRDDPAFKKLLVARIARQLEEFPGYARIPRIAVLGAPWTVESGCLTPTLKLRRADIEARHSAEIASIYPDQAR